MWVYAVAIGAALLFAVGSVVQQHSAAEAPPEKALSFSLLWHLLHQRLWLIGIGVSIVGNLLSAVALGAGGVALVQPLFTVRLLFALPLAAAWTRASITRRDWLGAAATAAGLAIFIGASHPHKGDNPLGAAWTSWAAAGGSLALIVAVLVVVARRLDPAREATLLGASAGVLFGLQSTLTESSISALRHGGAGHLLTYWQPYALVGCAVVGSLLIQSAYEMAPLAASFPTLVSAEPLTGLGLGVGVLGGSIRLSPLPLAIGLAGLLVMVGGVSALATSPLVTGQLDLLQRRRDEGIAYRTAAALEKDLACVQRDLDELAARLDSAGSARGEQRLLRETRRLLDRSEEELGRLAALRTDMEQHREAEVRRIAEAPAKERMMLAPLEEELDRRQGDIEAHAARLAGQLAALRDRARRVAGPAQQPAQE